MFTDMGVASTRRRSRRRFARGWRTTMPAGIYRAWLIEADDGAIAAGGGISILPWPPGPSYMGDTIAIRLQPVYGTGAPPPRSGAAGDDDHPRLGGRARHHVGRPECEPGRPAAVRIAGVPNHADSDDVSSSAEAEWLRPSRRRFLYARPIIFHARPTTTAHDSERCLTRDGLCGDTRRFGGKLNRQAWHLNCPRALRRG